VLSALLAASAAATPAPHLATMPVSEIKAGMHGYGLSVFRGTAPERFDVEVIDVLENFRPDQDLVLIRTPHPLLDHAGSVAGMSGSPIYIDGRLIGAYAYGWSFGKDPIAGVTPIANMLHELHRPRRPAPLPVVQPLPDPRSARHSHYDVEAQHDALYRLREHRARHAADRQGWVPAATPLLVGGMPPSVAALLREQLSPLGLEVLEAGGGARRSAPRDPAAGYVDGGAIAVTLLRGDVQATGVGTVTYVDGKRAVAFGHPMLDAGEVGFPTATARVLHVLASERSSFKIAEAVAPLGALVHDRQSAIVVDNDVTARTIPIRVTLAGVADIPRSEWNMDAADHRLLTPGLVLTAIGSALSASVNDVSDMMFRAESTLTLHGRPPITVVDEGYAPVGVAMGGALGRLRLFELLDVAYENPFERLPVERIDVKLSLRFARDVVELMSAQLATPELDPGEPARVLLKLRHLGGDVETRAIDVPLSATLAGEELELELSAGDRVRVEQPLAEGVDDLLRSARGTLPSTSLVIAVQRKSRGVSVSGHVLKNLPGSALDALYTAHDTRRQPSFQTQERVVVPLSHVVTGHAKLALEVRKEKR
jgi:SpoIVB peptidase S55